MMFLEWAQFQSLCFIVNFQTMLIKYKPTLDALFSYDIANCWMQIIYDIYCTYLDFVLFKKKFALCAIPGKPIECSSVASSTSEKQQRNVEHGWSPQTPLHWPLFPGWNR